MNLKPPSLRSVGFKFTCRVYNFRIDRYRHTLTITYATHSRISVNFENISRDCLSRDCLSRDCRTTFVRVSHDFPANVNYFHLNSFECRLVLFSRQIVARFSQDCRATVVRHSRVIRTSVAKISHCKFAKISRRQVRDTRANVARLSRDSLAKYF